MPVPVTVISIPKVTGVGCVSVSGYSEFELRLHFFPESSYGYLEIVEKALLTLQCEECWERITDPIDLEHPMRRNGAIICEPCHNEHEQECSRCLEWVDEDDMQAKPGDLIGIWEPAPSNNLERQLPPGYYRVLSWPFFTQPMIGSGLMDTEALEFVMPLDEAGARAIEETDAVSGPLCPECQLHLEAKLGTASRIIGGN